MSLKIYKKLDLTGVSCAGPLGELSGTFDELQPGEAVEVLLGDEATRNDILVWSKKRGAKIVEDSKEGNRYRLVIQRL
ncbi:response regulator SirA [Sulfolobales archaeon HS-7]|nr:response regulator SirA [Sulfolobales archaeon HS-7]